MSRAEYLVVLTIKKGMEAPTLAAIGSALEVGTEGAPEEWGFEAIDQIVVKEPYEPSARSAIERLRGALRDLVDDYEQTITGLLGEAEAKGLLGGAGNLLQAKAVLGDDGVPLQSVPHPDNGPARDPSGEKRQEDIDFFVALGWTWEYPGFLQAPGTPGYNFTVGLDESDVRFVVQVTDESGLFFDAWSATCNTREGVLEALETFKVQSACSHTDTAGGICLNCKYDTTEGDDAPRS
jgi:hypothetical protein